MLTTSRYIQFVSVLFMVSERNTSHLFRLSMKVSELIPMLQIQSVHCGLAIWLQRGAMRRESVPQLKYFSSIHLLCRSALEQKSLSLPDMLFPSENGALMSLRKGGKLNLNPLQRPIQLPHYYLQEGNLNHKEQS